jgi:NAD(P)-dependent dehydrogenase (short-subunit alcohol dehydrogenase family)
VGVIVWWHPVRLGAARGRPGSDPRVPTFGDMTAESATDLPSQAGRTVVVTGSNSGLGLSTARELARAGARVVMAVRDVTRGEQAAATIDGDVVVRHLDLADLESVRAFAGDWTGDLDVLVNNAGIMMVPAGLTADGFELQFGTNHLGHFALTNLLLPHVTDRVVTVASSMHRAGRIDLDDLNWCSRPYSATGAYGQSKLANLLFTLELQRRLTAAGTASPSWRTCCSPSSCSGG